MSARRYPAGPYTVDGFGLIQCGRGIARGKVYRHGPHERGSREDRAIARLFGTAPLVLDAAREVVAAWNGPFDPETFERVFSALADAVAEADGGDDDGEAPGGGSHPAQPEATGGSFDEAVGRAPAAAADARADAPDAPGLGARTLSGGHAEEAEWLAGRGEAWTAPRLVMDR